MVLVDDERANFRNDSSISAAKVLRYCKAGPLFGSWYSSIFFPETKVFGEKHIGSYDNLGSDIYAPRFEEAQYL